MKDDAELLRRYAEEGADDAFTELVHRHVDFVYAAALRQARNPQRAEDVTQMVFTDLARKAAVLARRDELVGWLYTGTRYAAIKVVRAEARRTCREQEAQVNEELMSRDGPPVDWEKLRPVLDEVLCDLNESERAAILLRFFKGCTFAEVGATMQLSEEAARKRVERALDRMHGLLGRRGVTSTAAALGVALANQTVVAAPVGLAASVVGTALTGAATAGGVATALVQLSELMVTSKSVVGVAVVASLLSVGLVVHETQQAQAVETAGAEAVQRYEKQVGRQRALSRRLETASELQRALQNKAAAARTASSSGKAISAPGATAVGALRAAADSASAGKAQAAAALGREFLAAHPEARAWLLAYQKSTSARTYGAFYRSLGLSQSQIEQFETLMKERWASTFSATGERTVTLSLATGSGDGGDQPLIDLLSEAGFQQFREYQRTRGARLLVAELAGGVYFSEAPLTSKQADEVNRILLNNSPDYRCGRSFEPYSPVDWEGVMAEAQGVLTDVQLVTLAEMRVNKERLRSLTEARMREASAPVIRPGGTN